MKFSQFNSFFPCYFSEPRRVATPPFARCGLFWFLIEINSEFSALFELVVGTQNSYWCSTFPIRCDMLTKRWWKLRTLSWIFDSIKRKQTMMKTKSFHCWKKTFPALRLRRVESWLSDENWIGSKSHIIDSQAIKKFWQKSSHKSLIIRGYQM